MPTNIFRGDAADISREVEMVLSGTWVAAETITITIGGQALVLTVGATVDIPTVLDNLIVMLTGVGTFGTDYSSAGNLRGNVLGMFAELTFTEDDADTLTIVATTPGRPFVIANSETSPLGSIAQTTTVAGSSKNDFETADNWSLGTVPVAADDIIYENSAIDCLYNLDQSAVAHNSIKVRQSFTGRIGLLENNRTDIVYEEYRSTFLQTASADIEIGEGSGTGSERIKIDSGTTTPVVINIINTGSGEGIEGFGAVIWQGTGANVDMTVQAGEVGLGNFGLDAADIDDLKVIDGIVKHINGTIDDIFLDGTGDVDAGDISNGVTQKGPGITTLRGALPSGAVLGIIIEKGTLNVLGTGTLQGLTVFKDAKVDASLNSNAITITDKITLHIGSTFLTPLGNVALTGGWTIPGGTLSDITLDLGKNRTTYTVA